MGVKKMIETTGRSASCEGKDRIQSPGAGVKPMKPAGAVRAKWNERGETLIEATASILIGTLSILMLFTGLMTSYQINLAAEKSDASFYQDLSLAEAQDDTSGTGTAGGSGAAVQNGTASVTMGSAQITFNVNIYGANGLFSYRKQAQP